MDADLVGKVNLIAAQFGYLGAAEAAEEVATHLERFWEPRLLRRLLEAGSAGLEPVAAAAVRRLRDRLPADPPG